MGLSEPHRDFAARQESLTPSQEGGPWAVRGALPTPPAAHGLKLQPDTLSVNEAGLDDRVAMARDVEDTPWVLRISGVNRHQAVSAEEAQRFMQASGMPAPYARILSQLEEMIRDVAADRVTSTVSRVTGRAPRSFESFARAHAARWR